MFLKRHYYRIAAATTAALTVMIALGGPAAMGQPQVRIPLVSNLVIGQTLHDGSAERESIVTIAEASPKSVSYLWTFLEVHADGDTVRDSALRVVSRADLATAERLREYYEKGEPKENPGYTRFTLSTAVFDRLRTTGTADYSILSSARSAAFGGSRPVIVRWRGKLTRVGSSYESFPLLFNGQRVRVPALHVKGQFTERGNQWTPDIWVLADRDHPLLLKIAADRQRIFQTVRVDIAPDIEKTLTTLCRAEIPGIYFDFNSAALDPASTRTIESLAAILGRHSEWSVTIEGHTDSVGTSSFNQKLSERRARSVRDVLISQYNIPSARLKAVGFGATRPRESNSTIEGRARNRRVEMQRPCGGQTS